MAIARDIPGFARFDAKSNADQLGEKRGGAGRFGVEADLLFLEEELKKSVELLFCIDEEVLVLACMALLFFVRRE